MDIEEYDVDNGYHMGVFLCLGQSAHNLKYSNSIHIDKFKNYDEIHQYMCENNKIFVFLGEGIHKIKKKAEQVACENAIRNLQNF